MLLFLLLAVNNDGYHSFKKYLPSAVQKLLSLIRSYLSIFAFISFALGDESKKYCYDLRETVLCLCFSPGFLWFLVLHLVFNPF